MKLIIAVVLLVFVSISQNAFAAYCAVPQANFCPANRFDNGDFEIVSDNPDKRGDQDIDLATGWSKITSDPSGDLADLYCPTSTDTSLPNPQSGVYASMWVSGTNKFKEGMFNKLKTPIPNGNTEYSFKFKTAKLLNNAPTVIGVYGVKYDTTTPLPTSMSGTVLDMFGAGNMVLLGEINVPASATQTWASQTITFNSNTFGTMSEINHILVSRRDTKTGNGAYMAFDDFCMRTTQEEANNGNPRVVIDIGPPIDIGAIDMDPDPNTSTCCPPLTGPAQIASLFNQTASTMGGSYKLELDGASAQYATFVQGYQAYFNLLKLNCTSVKSLDVTFTLHNASALGGTLGATLGTFKISFPSGTITPSLPQFSVALQLNQAYGVKATTQGVDAKGHAVNCGFDANQCSSSDRFTFERNVGGRVKSGSSKNSKDGLTIGK